MGGVGGAHAPAGHAVAWSGSHRNCLVCCHTPPSTRGAATRDARRCGVPLLAHDLTVPAPCFAMSAIPRPEQADTGHHAPARRPHPQAWRARTAVHSCACATQEHQSVRCHATTGWGWVVVQRQLPRLRQPHPLRRRHATPVKRGALVTLTAVACATHARAPAASAHHYHQAAAMMTVHRWRQMQQQGAWHL
jgi:hypothetical protein